MLKKLPFGNIEIIIQVSKKMEVFILKGFLQRLGKSLMMPISIIAAAGIFLGIAAALQNPNIVGESFINMEVAQNIIGFIRKLAGVLFANLPLLFAISLAIGMVDDEKPTAAFAGAIGFLVFQKILMVESGLVPSLKDCIIMTIR